VRLYHRTTRRQATAILASGFHDQRGHYGLYDAETGEPHTLTGVWLSDVPLDENEGAAGHALLRVTVALTDEELALYEVVEEPVEIARGPFVNGYREWCIPAAVLRGAATLELLDDEAEAQAIDERWNDVMIRHRGS